MPTILEIRSLAMPLRLMRRTGEKCEKSRLDLPVFVSLSAARVGGIRRSN